MPTTPTAIAAESPLQDDVGRLLAAEDAFIQSLYAPDDNHLLDATALADASVTFFVARRVGVAVGCGALVRKDGFGEIKRMFVDASARGQGIGARLLAHIERAARDAGLDCLRLETGIYQPEAIALYRSRGFREIGPFAGYPPSEVSLFMEKRL